MMLGRYTYSVSGGAGTMTTWQEFKYLGGRRTDAGSDRLGSDLSGGRTLLPYGEELTPTANGATKFATYWRDADTGLDYADQRYYQPGVGRFLAADPYLASAGPPNPGSWNRYAYTGGDPVNFNDPSGLLANPAVDSSGCMDDWTGSMWRTFVGNPCPPGMIPAAQGSSVSILRRTWEALDPMRHDIMWWQWGSTPGAMEIALDSSILSLISLKDLEQLSKGAPPQIRVGVIVITVIGLGIYDLYERLTTMPSRGKTPSEWEDEVTDPTKKWRAVKGEPDTWERDCPPGSPRRWEKVHRDEGIKYNEGLHWDYTDCEGKTWKDWPDGRRTPARP
jgi:RHS repeat-associated protein